MSDESRWKETLESEDNDTVARLVRLAGPRPSVPEARASRVRSAVRSRWHQRVRARRTRVRWFIAALSAAAATTIVVVQIRGLGPAPLVPEEPVAHVEKLTGPGAQVSISGATAPAKLTLDDSVPPGATVRTGTGGRAALRLTGGASLRMDVGTRVRLLTSSELQLDEGAVYVDNPSPASPAIEVLTSLGSAREEGTQFEVRLEDRSLRVRVREGSVVLDREGRAETARAGGELTVSDDGGLDRQSVSTHGPEWNWVTEVAPALEIEGQHLDVFLAWISRETGWRIRFQDGELSPSVSDTVLHGSIEGMTPADALASVLPACGLTHEVRDGVVYVGELGALDSRR